MENEIKKAIGLGVMSLWSLNLLIWSMEDAYWVGAIVFGFFFFLTAFGMYIFTR